MDRKQLHVNVLKCNEYTCSISHHISIHICHSHTQSPDHFPKPQASQPLAVMYIETLHVYACYDDMSLRLTYIHCNSY